MVLLSMQSWKNADLQKKMLLPKQLGITKEQVANVEKNKNCLKAQEANEDKLMDVAKALGYSAEQLQVEWGQC